MKSPSQCATAMAPPTYHAALIECEFIEFWFFFQTTFVDCLLEQTHPDFAFSGGEHPVSGDTVPYDCHRMVLDSSI